MERGCRYLSDDMIWYKAPRFIGLCWVVEGFMGLWVLFGGGGGGEGG